MGACLPRIKSNMCMPNPVGLKRHPKEGPLADFKTVVAAIKKDYPSVQKFGQQGFCWVSHVT